MPLEEEMIYQTDLPYLRIHQSLAENKREQERRQFCKLLAKNLLFS